MSEQQHWMESAAFAASDPGRVAVIVVLAEVGQPLDDMTLSQQAGLVYQSLVGQPIETAQLVRHIRDLEGKGLLEHDEAGFRWRLTPLGTIVSRPWATRAIDPPGGEPLSPDETRAWRDRIVAQLNEDVGLARQAGISDEELLAGLSTRLSELRVLNRVLGDEALPDWLREMAGKA